MKDATVVVYYGQLKGSTLLSLLLFTASRWSNERNKRKVTNLQEAKEALVRYSSLAATLN